MTARLNSKKDLEELYHILLIIFIIIIILIFFYFETGYFKIGIEKLPRYKSSKIKRNIGNIRFLKLILLK